jgi:hypothetical protein
MKKSKKKYFLKVLLASLMIFLLLSLFGNLWLFSYIRTNPSPTSCPIIHCLSKTQNLSSTHWIETESPDLNPKVLKLALTAYQQAKQKKLNKKDILTIVDYSKPSYAKRLWVIDFKHHQVPFYTYVAHGKGSGGHIKAKHFSDKNQTYASSIGTFLTQNTYHGRHGYSLRITGLEKGFNDHALQRQIVIHKAWYVGYEMVKHYGYIGRSWGCLALSPRLYKPIIDTIKNGSLIFSYYPDQKWLKQSAFLNSRSTTLLT